MSAVYDMRFLKYDLPPILCALAILTVSSIPNLKTPEVGWWATDKLAHGLEYAIFAFLARRSMIGLHGLANRRGVLVWTLAIVAGLAAIDEGLQGFVTGRVSDLWDWVADLVGGSIVVCGLWFRGSRKTSVKR